uniref:Uncharacterized protein n=1 Tax=Oryza glumipatula TaxID=40148 RepID=A0A0E0A7B9_9ORYZ
MEEDLLSEEDATASGRVWRRTCSKRRAASDDLRCEVWMIKAWMVEDLLLVNYIAAHVSSVQRLKWAGKSCLLWCLNYLRPDVRQGNMMEQEQLLILELHGQEGEMVEQD